MASRSKRTYSLRPETIRRVRELAERGYASSQDAVVDAAVERLHRELAEVDEANAWAAAAHDPEFRREMEGIAASFDEPGRWPA
jgi:hypothetical protein